MTKEDEARIRERVSKWDKDDVWAGMCRILLAEIDALRREYQACIESHRRADVRIEELEAILADPDPAIMPTPKRNP